MKYYNSNQMDLSDRIVIETGIYVHDSFKEIARQLHRHPSTIAREIKNNLFFIPGNDFMHNNCAKVRGCQRKQHMCGRELCFRTCIACSEWDCRKHCEKYVRKHCNRAEGPPYVCNTCSDKKLCTIDRYIYSARRAQKISDERMSMSRRGLQMFGPDLKSLADLLAPRIKKGQPLAHIYAEHKNDIPVCLRTIYNYIDSGELGIHNVDLRRKVKYRKRRKIKGHKDLNQQYRQRQ